MKCHSVFDFGWNGMEHCQNDAVTEEIGHCIPCLADDPDLSYVQIPDEIMERIEEYRNTECARLLLLEVVQEVVENRVQPLSTHLQDKLIKFHEKQFSEWHKAP